MMFKVLGVNFFAYVVYELNRRKTTGKSTAAGSVNLMSATKKFKMQKKKRAAQETRKTSRYLN